MGRPKWTPQNDEQRQAIAAARRAAKRADSAEDQLWQVVATAMKTGVPAAYMADAVGRGRATLYRRLPHTQDRGDEAVQTDC